MTFRGNKLLLVCALGLCACTATSGDGPSEPLTVFAAASLSNALPEIADAFERQHEDCRIAFNFAASSILAKQLERGARADLFVSANTRWLAYLIQQKKIRPDSRSDFLSNRLVVVVPANARVVPRTVHDLTRPAFRRIAVGDPQHVPLGIYARDALQAAGVWETVEDRLVPALDARAALAYVEQAQVECGLVYRSDVALNPHIRIAFELPPEWQPRIRYALGLPGSASPPLARAFADFLRGHQAQDIFLKHGFYVHPADAEP